MKNLKIALDDRKIHQKDARRKLYKSLIIINKLKAKMKSNKEIEKAKAIILEAKNAT